MKKVFLTGASGFIGRQCVSLLAAKGLEVHAVSSRSPVQIVPDIRWHRVDLLDSRQAKAIVAKIKPDSLLHFAWYTVPGKYWTCPENLRWVEASLSLLREFHRAGGARVVMAGSCAEYEWKDAECCEETTALAPTSVYGAAKKTLQSLLGSFGHQSGMSSAWGRIFHLYGPHEHPSRLVSSVIRLLLRGEPVPCSDGRQVLDFLHVADVASAFVALLESNVEGPVNIASGVPVTVRRVVETIAQKIARPDLVRFGARPATPGPSRLVACVRRLVREVGWKPHYALDTGLDQTIQWWRDCDAMRAAAIDREESVRIG